MEGPICTLKLRTIEKRTAIQWIDSILQPIDFSNSHSLANALSLPTMAEVTSPSGTIIRSDSFSGRESLNVSMDTSNMKHFVTQGPYNILLSYVVHFNSNGVILFHTNENPAIAAMFSLKCQVVRQVLQSKRFIAEDPVVEFGIHIDQKIPLSATSTGHIGYWICGRMNDKMDEFYICYEDSISQDVVELSYRLYSRLYIFKLDKMIFIKNEKLC